MNLRYKLIFNYSFRVNLENIQHYRRNFEINKMVYGKKGYFFYGIFFENNINSLYCKNEQQGIIIKHI